MRRAHTRHATCVAAYSVRKGKREREGEREREGREIRRHPLRQGVPVLPAPPPRALQQGAEVPI